jgi:hypothetical protein
MAYNNSWGETYFTDREGEEIRANGREKEEEEEEEE